MTYNIDDVLSVFDPDYKKDEITSEINHDFDKNFDNELYREYQQANFDEYFDWARTYRFCKF